MLNGRISKNFGELNIQTRSLSSNETNEIDQRIANSNKCTISKNSVLMIVYKTTLSSMYGAEIWVMNKGMQKD